MKSFTRSIHTLILVAAVGAVAASGCRRAVQDDSDLPPVTASKDDTGKKKERKSKKRRRPSGPPTHFDFEKEASREITMDNAASELAKLEADILAGQKELQGLAEPAAQKRTVVKKQEAAKK